MDRWAVTSSSRCALVLLLVTSLVLAEKRRSSESTEAIVTSSYSIDRFLSLNLTSNIKTFIDHETLRLRIITNFSGHEDEVPFVKQRLAEFKLIHKSLLKNSTSTKSKANLRDNHPTTVLAALRDFLATWENKLANTTIYGTRLREFLELNSTKPLPTRKDLNMAGTSVTIIQATYNLSISDLLKGHVLGKKGESLSHADCYDIGRTVLQAGLLDTANDWLEMAISSYDLEKLNVSKQTFNLSDALASLGRIAFKRKDQKRALKLFEKANEIDPDNLFLYQEYVKHRFGRDVEELHELNREKVEPWRKKFYDMCHNSTNATWLLSQRLLQPKLKCRLRFSQTVPYLVYKEEILNKSPYISLILDFLSQDQTEKLKNSTLPLLKETLLPGSDPYLNWHYKGGHFRDFHSKDIRHVSELAGDVTGLKVSQGGEWNNVGEPVQVIDYGMSGLTLPHSELKMKFSDPYMGKSRGNRFATLHVYLSDVTAGGATVFIQQNITVVPKQGMAVLWYNYKPSGEPEPDFYSSTCPLAVGTNIVLEKGIWLSPRDDASVCGRSPKSTFVTSDRIQSCHPVLCR